MYNIVYHHYAFNFLSGWKIWNTINRAFINSEKIRLISMELD